MPPDTTTPTTPATTAPTTLTVTFKAVKANAYLSAPDSVSAVHDVSATGVARSLAQTFQIVPDPTDTAHQYVFIQDSGGKFLQKSASGSLIVGNEQNASAKFKIANLYGDCVSLQAQGGTYVSVADDHQGKVVASSTAQGPTEQFLMERIRTLNPRNMGDTLTAQEWFAIQAFVNTGLNLPTTDSQLRQALQLLPGDDVSAFSDMRDAYSTINGHCATWRKADNTGVYDDIVSLASDIYNYAKMAIGCDPATAPVNVGDNPRGYYGALQHQLDLMLDNPSVTVRNTFNALLTRLINEAGERATRASTVAGRVSTFISDVTADQARLNAPTTGLIPTYNARYGNQSAEVKRLLDDVALAQDELAADSAEYAHDCIVAETSPTYVWVFPIGTIAAIAVAGDYGKRAADAKRRINDEQDRIVSDNAQLNRAYHVMATLQLAGGFMENVLDQMTSALFVLQKLQGIWNAMAADLRYLRDSVLKGDIEQADDFIKSLGVSEAITSWAALGRKADKFRTYAYVTIQQVAA
ncbi:alpha-xenorhabdolysin family binary toxin subunit A [Myxococcaceae bacterium GXIMD 01537]